jgi:nicotinic acid mononucleotide adenylyltransferase
MNSKVVAAITGGGAKWVGDTLARGGLSPYFLEATVPYSMESLDSYLGRRPDKYCSADTACQMAMRAFERARQLAPNESVDNLIGLGVTASLYKDKQREGRVNKIFVATQYIERTSVDTYVLLDENRQLQEEWAARIIGHCCPFDISDFIKYLPPEHIQFEDRKIIGAGPFQCLYEDKCDFMFANSERGADDASKRKIIFSSSCNPFHNGHKAMIDYARKNNPGVDIYCELSILNYEKPKVHYISLDERLRSVPAGLFTDTIVSTLPTYLKKAEAMPNTTFAIGSDTLNRIDWRKDRPTFSRYGIKFIVFPRPFQEVKDKSLMYDSLISFAFDFEPSALSSTEIRQCLQKTDQ